MPPGYKPGDPLKKFIKNYYNKHTHTVTHAACAATDAAYPSDTSITSSSPSPLA